MPIEWLDEKTFIMDRGGGPFRFEIVHREAASSPGKEYIIYVDVTMAKFGWHIAQAGVLWRQTDGDRVELYEGDDPDVLAMQTAAQEELDRNAPPRPDESAPKGEPPYLPGLDHAPEAENPEGDITAEERLLQAILGAVLPEGYSDRSLDYRLADIVLHTRPEDHLPNPD